MKIVEAGPRLHIVNLRHSTVNVYHRDNDIICVLAQTVSRGDGAKVCCRDDVVCGSNGRSVDNACRYLMQCRRLTTVHGAVRVAVEVLDQPVMYVVRDVYLAVFILRVLNV